MHARTCGLPATFFWFAQRAFKVVVRFRFKRPKASQWQSLHDVLRRARDQMLERASSVPGSGPVPLFTFYQIKQPHAAWNRTLN
jgi:hypothetical protein